MTLNSLTYLKSVLCGKYGWELCSKVYKRQLFNSAISTPKNISIGEDAAVFIQLITKSTVIVGCDYTFYNYIQFSQSASHIQTVEYAEETLLAACFIESYLKKQPFYELIKDEISAMFLLFYSNSTRRAFLVKRHQLLQVLKNKHFRISALRLLPWYKAIYVLVAYYLISKK